MKKLIKQPPKGLFLEAQKLVNDQYSIKKMEIMGQKNKKNLEIENFKKELKKHVDIKNKNDNEIYEIARKMTLLMINKGLSPSSAN